MSHVSLSPSTTSSDRTAFSSRSVFSSASASTTGYDSIISEENYNPDPRYASNLQLEPVDARSGSRAGERGVKVAQQSPFARALAKMEGAGPRIITARLSEEWEGLEDDESYQEVVFEKRLWALTAYQRLTQNKQIQSPAHELLSGSRPADQRRILHLHGSLGMYKMRCSLLRLVLSQDAIVLSLLRRLLPNCPSSLPQRPLLTTPQPTDGCWPRATRLPRSIRRRR